MIHSGVKYTDQLAAHIEKCRNNFPSLPRIPGFQCNCKQLKIKLRHLDTTAPFSPFLLCACEVLEAENDPTCQTEWIKYLRRVVLELMHLHHDPVPFILLLSRYNQGF